MDEVVPDANRPNNVRSAPLTYVSPFHCDDDRFEPNNDDSSATEVSAGLLFMNYPGLTLCEGDVDTFTITIPQNRTNRFLFTFSHAQGDLDAYLWSSSGQLLEASNGTDDNEYFEWHNGSNEDRTYTIVVVQGSAATKIDYDFNVGAL